MVQIDFWFSEFRINFKIFEFRISQKLRVFPNSEFLKLEENENIEVKTIRFRTLGDITITGGIESDADTLAKIVEEVSTMRLTERGNRADDKRSESAMEDRKRQGYF